MLLIEEILQDAIEKNASDIFLIGGLPLTYKICGVQKRMDEDNKLFPDDIDRLIKGLYTMLERPERENKSIEDDFSFAFKNLGRFRANIFTQRGSSAAVIRVIRFGVPDPAECHMPKEVLDLADTKAGLVLVTGAAGSGKTTTLACILDEINKSYDRTVITMEDPIEIVHRHKKSIIIQREISTDTESFHSALKSAMREAPDTLLIGEIRDADTMRAAMTAAETGQLVLSSLHTMSAADTVDRITDFFPNKEQLEVRAQLAGTLKCVVCQRLVMGENGPVPVFEIMKVTPAIKNLIREGKTYQFKSFINEGVKYGMCTMDMSLLKLAKEGLISKETAILNSDNPSAMENKLG